LNKVSKSQAAEWVENPVTLAVVDHLRWELDTIVASKGLDAFHPFQADRTQEILSSLNGAAETIERCLDAFSDGDELMELFEEEDERDQS